MTMPRTSRRAFIRNSAVAAAGIVGVPRFIASCVCGANGSAPPSNRIVMGCIGVGGQGTNNMKNFLNIPDVRVVAVCDVRQERQQKAKAIVDNHYNSKDCATYTDFRQLLARPDVDAVMIATQDHWHALIAVAAAGAGKDMYCEKPLGVSVNEGKAIVEAVRRYGRIFQTGTQQRSERNFRFACELARNGYVGRIHTIKVAAEGPNYRPSYKGPMTPQPVPNGLDYDMYHGPALHRPYNPGLLAWPDWYLIWDYCAGFIVNWGVHHLDIACWGHRAVADQPFELTCRAKYRNEGFTDNVDSWHSEFTYANGLRMIFTDHFGANKLGCRFEGDEGWVHVDRAGIWAGPESLLAVKLKGADSPLHESNNHHNDFIKSVRSRSDPVSPVEAGHKASCLGLVADIAARLGRSLQWNPAPELFVNDDQANRVLARPYRSPWCL